MFFQEPVDYTNILRGISEACDDLNNSSNDQLTNQYYGSLSNEEKDIFDRFSDVKSFACAMKNQKLFTLQDLKVVADSFIDCSNLIALNSTIVKFSYEWVYSENVCVLERLKSVKSDNSIDVEGLKKYVTAYLVWRKTVTDV
ncbi:GSCOCG00012799001-RA-CDS, partial [Cotesia congregata]